MKNKFLKFALIALLFTACKPTPEGGDGTNPNGGDGESSYIAITLASDGNRGDFEEGSEEERLVKNAHVFFFRDGNAFNVGTEKNYITIEVTNTNDGAEDGNVEDVTGKVMVIENYQGELPNQMVAVLNWTPTESQYSLEGLQNKIVGHINNNFGDNANYFIMSNSTYKDASGDVYATPLKSDDFKTTKEDAQANPVKIYVERVAAKVRVNTPGDIDNDEEGTIDEHIFELLGVDLEGTYAQIKGWTIYNANTQSYLLKNLPSLPYNDESLGFYWNSPSNHRSYWAESCTNYFNEVEGVDTLSYKDRMYCCENTLGNAEADLRTKVIITAQLQDAGGNVVEVARWFGEDYSGREPLLKAVANTLVNTYYYKEIEGESAVYRSITWEDLMAVQKEEGDGVNIKEYQVYFQLKEENSQDGGVYGVEKEWYVIGASGEFVEISDANLNAELIINIKPALLYANGMTYYFTDIKHLGGNYGVVRNHVYDMNIKSITGYGTPVSSDNVIDEPTEPEDHSTFVAAEINILSWRVVSNDIDL